MQLYMERFYVLFIIQHLNRVSLINEKYVNHSDVNNAYTINFMSLRSLENDVNQSHESLIG